VKIDFNVVILYADISKNNTGQQKTNKKKEVTDT